MPVVERLRRAIKRVLGGSAVSAGPAAKSTVVGVTRIDAAPAAAAGRFDMSAGRATSAPAFVTGASVELPSVGAAPVEAAPPVAKEPAPRPAPAPTPAPAPVMEPVAEARPAPLTPAPNPAPNAEAESSESSFAAAVRAAKERGVDSGTTFRRAAPGSSSGDGAATNDVIIGEVYDSELRVADDGALYWGPVDNASSRAKAAGAQLDIDRDECIGCGTCVEHIDTVFFLNDDEGKAYVIAQEGAMDRIDDAIDACPVTCISWLDAAAAE
jgi:ferredoxin